MLIVSWAIETNFMYMEFEVMKFYASYSLFRKITSILKAFF